MRILLAAATKCLILIRAQSAKDVSDLDSDEGPLRKYRRLTLEQSTAGTMNRMRRDQAKLGIADSRVGTKDVAVLCSNRVPVNDKCVMVGTTGITALKAKFGDDFKNFEIIQDVGYSSESSTHLSGDDGVIDNYNVRSYEFPEGSHPISLREELENARKLHSFPSSFDSSSSAAVSLDDSGLGTGETLTTRDSLDVPSKEIGIHYEQEDLDFFNSVLSTAESSDSKPKDFSEAEELHFNISGIESDDPSETFHNRSSFTTSAQVFYKMTSVDSDNGEAENNAQENTSSPENGGSTWKAKNSAESPRNNGNFIDSDSDSDRIASAEQLKDSAIDAQKIFCSTPVKNAYSYYGNQGVKRKRDFENLDKTRMANQISSWLNRCTDYSNNDRTRNSIFRNVPESHLGLHSAGVSSCDASCECTSSSADEGNVYSSSSSFVEGEVSKTKIHMNSWRSADGSIETVVHSILDSSLLLPPPPSSTTSCNSSISFCHKACCQFLRGMKVLKAFSESDLRSRKTSNDLSSLTSGRDLKKYTRAKSASSLTYSHSLSLPTVLYKVSDSSTDDNYILSSQLSNSDVKNATSHHNSSCSDAGRRRRRSRKKSSSSNRSSQSIFGNVSDSVAQRSRTLTSNKSSRLRRHSHRSHLTEKESEDEVCPLELEIPSENTIETDNLGTTSSILLSPIESDVVALFEEQSTVSDQVWDGYQEMRYLSENYSEGTVDEDAVRKLTEFGDDYGSAIGQSSTYLLLPGCEQPDSKRSPKKYTKSYPGPQRLDSVSDDSDSEDLHCVVESAFKALKFARNILSKRENCETKYVDLLATCGTHLQWLQKILQYIETDGIGHNFSAEDLNQLHCLIKEWKKLQHTVEMLEKPTNSVAQQKYLEAQKGIDDLFGKMTDLLSESTIDTTSFDSWDDLQKSVERLQMVLTTLQETKEQLLTVNLKVHRFTTEFGSDVRYQDCSLKSDVTELYRQWEDAYEESKVNISELELLKSRWKDFDENCRNLICKVKIAELNALDDCDSPWHKSTHEDYYTFQKELENLRVEGSYFERRLSCGELWKSMKFQLDDLERRIQAFDRKTCIPKRSGNYGSPSACVEDDADDHFVDAADKDDDEDSTSSDLQNVKKASTEKGKGRLWRVARLAFPIQFALVFLYCLACYLEPNCCNMINNFNFSLTPQLRYFGGRPPV